MEPSNLERGNAVLQTIHSSDGGRALKLLQKRQKQQAEAQATRGAISEETKRRKVHGIEEKYHGSSTDAIEDAFKAETVGLISAEAFKEKRQKMEQRMAEQAATEAAAEKAQGRRQTIRVTKNRLSFEESEASEEETKDEEEARPMHFGKDPTAATHFVKDPDRDAKERADREALLAEYQATQDKIKEEEICVAFSYFDGAGHRRNLRTSKGTTIFQFLEKAKAELQKDFPELRNTQTENLMFIKEDVILPHRMSFYDFIKAKARGKSGPLFRFDVHEDVRYLSDSRIEKTDSHAAKLVERRWFEKNRDIFPASRWIAYDPEKSYDRYTVSG